MHVARPATFDKSRRRACEYLRPVYARAYTQKSSSIIHNSVFLGGSDFSHGERLYLVAPLNGNATRFGSRWDESSTRRARASLLRRSIQVARLFYSFTAFFASENVWKIRKERMENGENFSQRPDLPTSPPPLLSSRASLQRNGLIQEITALPLLIYYVSPPSVYCPRLSPT